MSHAFPDLPEVAACVRDVAREVLPAFFERVTRDYKADGSLVTEADHAMQEALAAALRDRWPDYPLLGEEMSSERQTDLFASAADGLWCLDPLDGTSNFAAGLPFFSVSLALLADGRRVLGVVYDPVRDETFSARAGSGAFLNGRPLRADTGVPPLNKCLAAVDFKRLPPAMAAALAAAPPYASQRSLGSVALDWCWVAAGRFHVYLHGKQKLWDYAAGSLVLDEAGGHSATLQGEAVFDGGLTPRSALAAGEASLFRAWAAHLAALPGAPGRENAA